MKNKEIIKILKNNGIGILATDTIYGLVGSALSKKATDRIYKIRKRDSKKPFIILIGSLTDLKKFGIKLTPRLKNFLNKVWPGAVSVIINNTAFRLPAKSSLRKLLKQTGPLVAPSANLSGMPPAKNITEAKKYFADKIDFYADSGTIKGAPSILIEIKRL